MKVLGMVAAVAAAMAFGGAEAAPSRDARGKQARASAPAARAAAPAPTVRPVVVRPSTRPSARETPRLEPMRRGERVVAVLPLERYVPVSSARRLAAVPRGWEARPRWEAASRFSSRAEPRRSTAGDRWTSAAPPAGVRSVGFFSRPAFAATMPVTTRDDDDDDRRVAMPRRGGAWHAGLPAAEREQRDCPAGTMSVPARGHVETFRCMPI